MKSCVLALLMVVGLPAVPAAETHVVDPGGSGDFPTIQTAIDASQDGDVVELTDGVFAGEGNRDLDFLGKRITLRSQGGDPEACIVDCQGSADDPHRGVFFRSGEGIESVLAGVTIRNGFAQGEVPYDCGAGIFCKSGSSPTLERCIFADNTAPEGGGGGVYADSCSPRLTNCIFMGNLAEAGGGIDCANGSAILLDCQFHNNTATWGGAVICCYDPGPSLEGCLFQGNSANYGGAVYW